jgi:ribonuclease R
MDLAAQAGPAPLGGRADLRAVPLVTIDGADARDFDDAVFAAPDEDSANRDGWHLIVAIADVAWYVRPGDALDRAALDRGNSIYFPDRVVPMLPEALSNGWCSLKPGEDRPCMAAHLWIDKTGRLVRHRFERALMRSAARLTYEEVQAAADGDAAAMPAGVVDRLYGAYRALKTARDARQPLDLDLPERIIELDDKGRVETIGTRARLDSHRLIEEFMIAANVAAAETLEKLRQPCMYRVHDEPPPEKLVALRDVLSGIGLNFAKGQVVMPRSFNQILKLAEGTGDAPLVSEIVLRTQAQAIYSPENIGHFGLALRRYAHFTSPIRRYADLMVHRALISGIKAGPGGLPQPLPDFTTIGEHISMTERRAVEAERDAADRYTSAFLSDRVGEIMEARVTGVTRFGLFVTLAASGGDALLPMRDLPGGPYTHDTRRHVLRARRGKKLYRLGDTLSVRLTEADPITGGLVVRLSETR